MVRTVTGKRVKDTRGARIHTAILWLLLHPYILAASGGLSGTLVVCFTGLHPDLGTLGNIYIGGIIRRCSVHMLQRRYTIVYNTGNCFKKVNHGGWLYGEMS